MWEKEEKEVNGSNEGNEGNVSDEDIDHSFNLLSYFSHQLLGHTDGDNENNDVKKYKIKNNFSSEKYNDGSVGGRERREMRDLGYQRGLATATANTLYNPVVCLVVGASIIFDVSKTIYPVYMKDSLLNTNPDFDYSSFRELAALAATSATVSSLAFTFTSAGKCCVCCLCAVYVVCCPCTVCVVHCPCTVCLVCCPCTLLLMRCVLLLVTSL